MRPTNNYDDEKSCNNEIARDCLQKYNEDNEDKPPRDSCVVAARLMDFARFYSCPQYASFPDFLCD